MWKAVVGEPLFQADFCSKLLWKSKAEEALLWGENISPDNNNSELIGLEK